MLLRCIYSARCHVRQLFLELDGSVMQSNKYRCPLENVYHVILFISFENSKAYWHAIFVCPFNFLQLENNIISALKTSESLFLIAKRSQFQGSFSIEEERKPNNFILKAHLKCHLHIKFFFISFSVDFQQKLCWNFLEFGCSVNQDSKSREKRCNSLCPTCT